MMYRIYVELICLDGKQGNQNSLNNTYLLISLRYLATEIKLFKQNQVNWVTNECTAVTKKLYVLETK